MQNRNNLRLYEFHRSLYLKALQNASHHTPLDTPNLLRYAEEFYKSLPKKYKESHVNALIRDLEKKDLLIYGDFHTHWQTQKGLIRILEQQLTFHPEREVVISVEMFRASDQVHINRYLRDEITEDALLEAVEYDRFWGFPWENYRMIVNFAKANDIAVFGINSDEAGRDSLATRDSFAAEVIADLSKRYPESLNVCLIGEFHLADEHLPKQLTPYKIRHLRVLTNIDQFYFDRKTYTDYSKNEYLYLKEGLYCLLNSPPWIKWQSYSLWEEMKSAEEEEDESDLYTDESFDIDGQIQGLLQQINEFLNLNISEIELTNFNSSSFLTAAELSHIASRKDVSSYSSAILEQRLAIDKHFYLPERRLCLINKVSLNHLASLSGQILFSMLHPIKDLSDDEEIFFHRILMISSGILTVKILNPRFKCPDIFSFEADLKRLNRRRLGSGDQTYRKALRYVIKLYYKILLGRYRISKQIASYDRENHGLYSLMIGQLIGVETYKLIMNPYYGHDFKDSLQFRTSDTESCKALIKSILNAISRL